MDETEFNDTFYLYESLFEGCSYEPEEPSDDTGLSPVAQLHLLELHDYYRSQDILSAVGWHLSVNTLTRISH
jgi:hypothetical protein